MLLSMYYLLRNYKTINKEFNERCLKYTKSTQWLRVYVNIVLPILTIILPLIIFRIGLFDWRITFLSRGFPPYEPYKISLLTNIINSIAVLIYMLKLTLAINIQSQLGLKLNNALIYFLLLAIAIATKGTAILYYLMLPVILLSQFWESIGVIIIILINSIHYRYINKRSDLFNE
ncbi:MAG: hypothetical protein FWC41_11645 [Firmicutes bacterium]|nr:hypothetical protein [Bacillota bacterium]